MSLRQLCQPSLLHLLDKQVRQAKRKSKGRDRRKGEVGLKRLRKDRLILEALLTAE